MTRGWCLGLFMLSLALAYLFHGTEAEDKGSDATTEATNEDKPPHEMLNDQLGTATVGTFSQLDRTIYKVNTVAGKMMSLTTLATVGCVHYPSNCDLKVSIRGKEPQAVQLLAQLTNSSQTLYTLYGENVDLWNQMNPANVQHERVIGLIEVLEELANDIINRLDLSTDVLVIDNNSNITDQTLDTISTEIAELNQALLEKKVQDGIPSGISTTGSAIYYGFQMYSEKAKHRAKHEQAERRRRNSDKVHRHDLQHFEKRMANIQTYFEERPQLVRVISAAYYGISALLGGLTLDSESANATTVRQDMERIDSDLDFIINNYTDTNNILSELLEEQREINAKLIQNFEHVKEKFLDSNTYLERLRLDTTVASKPELWTLSNFTTDNVNMYNIFDSITGYYDLLTEVEKQHIAIDNRLQAVTMIENMLDQSIAYHVSLLLTKAQAIDETMTRDAVLATIADKMPGASTWPDTKGPVELAPYRGI